MKQFLNERYKTKRLCSEKITSFIDIFKKMADDFPKYDFEFCIAKDKKVESPMLQG